ncbi:MAG: hypothetical protein OXG58_01750 [Gemmatimonadetes bacterium]|nr:hypothetical protein [Gemmatimonadota bacterium]
MTPRNEKSPHGATNPEIDRLVFDRRPDPHVRGQPVGEQFGVPLDESGGPRRSLGQHLVDMAVDIEHDAEALAGEVVGDVAM